MNIIDSALVGTALAIFAVVFSDAAAGWSAPGWQYEEVVGTVLTVIPPLLGVGAAVVFLGVIMR